ncbi:hypothetical protein JW921_11710 [Candidatus Fermentibacterales bacterium]|nr:hypothetical protein [Candidatus Fermentibacterales bacterium]
MRTMTVYEQQHSELVGKLERGETLGTCNFGAAFVLHLGNQLTDNNSYNFFAELRDPGDGKGLEMIVTADAVPNPIEQDLTQALRYGAEVTPQQSLQQEAEEWVNLYLLSSGDAVSVVKLWWPAYQVYTLSASNMSDHLYRDLESTDDGSE